MKQILTIVAVATVIMCTSCKSGGGSSSPIGALKSMEADTKKGDFKAIMKQLCAADAKAMEGMMGMMEGVAKMMGKTLDDMMKEAIKEDKKLNFSDVEFKDEKINGDNATVTIVNKKDGTTENVELKKENGTWKMCPGIANEMKKGMNALNDPTDTTGTGNNVDMKKAMEKLNDPETQKKMQEAMKNIKPEDIENAKKLIEQAGKGQ